MKNNTKKLFSRFGVAISRHPWLTLLAISVSYILEIIININRWPIWFDEGYSQFLSQFDYGKIASLTAVDVHPPFYYWALHTWGEMFGYGETAVRSLSAVFGLLALIGLFMFIKKALKRTNLALLATGFVAFLPFLVHYSVETRMYTMAAAIVVWASYVLLIATEKKTSWRWWILYGLLVSAGMWTHYFTAFAWIAHVLWRFIEYRRKTIKPFWSKYWIGAYALSVVGFLPWISTAYKQFTGIQKGFWIPQISPTTVTDYLGDTYLYTKTDLILNWGSMVFFALAAILVAVVWWYVKKRPRQLRENSAFRLMAIMAFVPPLLLVFMSLWPFESTFVDRYMTYAIMFLVALVVVVLIYVAPSSRVRKNLLISLAVIQLIGLASLYVIGGLYSTSGGMPNQARALIRDVDATDTNGVPIAISGKWMIYESDAYATASHPILMLEDNDYPWGSYEPFREQKGIILTTPIDNIASNYTKLWLLTNGDPTVPEGWHSVKTLTTEDPLVHKSSYKITLIERN